MGGKGKGKGKGKRKHGGGLPDNRVPVPRENIDYDPEKLQHGHAVDAFLSAPREGGREPKQGGTRIRRLYFRGGVCFYGRNLPL
jgi:hypothetical protein